MRQSTAPIKGQKMKTKVKLFKCARNKYHLITCPDTYVHSAHPINLLCAKFKFCTSSTRYVLLFRYHCMSLYSCQLWELDSANIQLFYTAWRRCIRRIFHRHPRTHNTLLPAICQTDITKVLCDRIQSLLGKAEVSGNMLLKFCSLFVNCRRGSSVCNSKNLCLCTRTNHNCDGTTLRLGGFIRDFISYTDDVPHEDNLQIIIDFLCTE